MEKRTWFLAVTTAVLVLALGVHQSRAATIAVSTTADDLTVNGNCTLREAIKTANTQLPVDACTTGTGNDTITLGIGTYLISINGANEDANATGDFDILPNTNIQISGDSASTTTINAQSKDRVFHVLPGAGLMLQQLTVTGGSVNSVAGGGGVYVDDGTLFLGNAIVSGNHSTNASGYGGGIYYKYGTTPDALMWLMDSIVDQNTSAGNGGGVAISGASGSFGNVLNGMAITNNTAAGDGGGVDLVSSTMTIFTSTFSGNSAANAAGVLAEAGAVASVNGATIANNTATNQGGGFIQRGSGPTFSDVTNSLLANNHEGVAGGIDCMGSITSTGAHNLIRSISGCTRVGATAGDITGQDPQLQALASNGFFSSSHALASTSPAIDTGSDTYCLSTDQRYMNRQERDLSSTAACDIGAYEYDFTPTIAFTTTVASPTSSSTPTITVNATESGTLAVGGGCTLSGTATFSGPGTGDITFAALADGPHVCSVTLTDDTGHSSGYIFTNAFTIDTAAPALTLTQSPTRVGSQYQVSFTSSEFGALRVGPSCTANYPNAIAGSNIILLTVPSGSQSCWITVTDSAGNVSTVLSLPTILNLTSAPTIALSGMPIATAPLYATVYPKASAEARDALGTNLASRVTVVSTVNLNKAGIYSNIYDVTDANGVHPATLAVQKVVVLPNISNVKVTSQGSATIKNLKKKSVVLQPFGAKYTGAIFARKINWGGNVVTYVFMTSGGTSAWKIRAYDVNGKLLKNTLALRASFTKKGVNIALAADPVSGEVLLGLGSKSSNNVPHIYTISPKGVSERKVSSPSNGSSGNVLVKFAALDGGQLTLITGLSAGKQPRVWRTTGAGKGFALDTTHADLRISMMNGQINILSPIISNVFLTPNPSGNQVGVTWTVSRVADGIVNWGPTTAYGSHISDFGFAQSHTLIMNVTANSTTHIIIRSCVPNLAPTVGCTTGPDMSYQTL